MKKHHFFKEKAKVPAFVLGECVEEVKLDQHTVETILSKYRLERSRYILSVGRIVWYKGYDLLLHAWKHVEHVYNELKLVIVGKDYGYKSKLLKLIRKYNLRNVVFLEDVQSMELHALYEGCLFAVSLSRFETFHRIAIEAWSHKKPIVALDLGPATRHIFNAKGGILTTDDPLSIIKAFFKLISNTKCCRELGYNGYIAFKRNYSSEIYAKKLLTIYESLPLR
ncbi:MAG: hypothetical protein DRN15_09720 [Thermoprotei archaeon]|nr:MAG: hypothetical protein DRN15_09720 [Thermoprotei archaeon]